MGRSISGSRLAGLVVATGLAFALAGCTTVAGPPGPEAAVTPAKARHVAAGRTATRQAAVARPAAAPPRRIVVLGAGW
jgi:ABC-type Fe3+-hydroxamate transport system substrate-binding protein